MNLFFIILFLFCFSFIPKIFPKYNKYFVFLSILLVLSCYFSLSKNFFHLEKEFYPSQQIQVYTPLGNYYNFLVKSLKRHKLYLLIDCEKYPKLKSPGIYKNYEKYTYEDNNLMPLFDTSLYKGKIYLYFGITPVLLFYLPFNLITDLYLTDKFLVFVLSCISFLLLVFFFFKLKKRQPSAENFDILSIFLIGFCSILPFILIRSCIYEVAIITANVLLLLSFAVFYYNLLYSKFSYFFVFLLGLLLSFSVGARPHYVLFIPVFLSAVIWIKYNETKNIKTSLKHTIIFLIPCIFVGLIIAGYNYLRFDSIFEFGWKYQLNYYHENPSLKDFFLALKYNIFSFPNINEKTVFSLAQSNGHSVGNEFVTGIIWTFPLIFLFVFIPKFLKDIFKENKNIFYVVVLMTVVVMINIFVISFVGMVIRFFFEYMSFIVVLSLILFYYVYTKLNTNFLKKTAEIFFILIFVYSVFINISLLFCENNSKFYAPSSRDNYPKTVQFLFKK